MNEKPASGSVPDVPAPHHDPQPDPLADPGRWSVPGALLATLVVIGGAQVMGLVLLQLFVAGAMGASALFDAKAVQGLPEATRHALFLAIQLAVTMLQLMLVTRLAGATVEARRAALDIHRVRLGAGGWLKALALVFAVKIVVTMLAVPLTGADPKGELAPLVAFTRSNVLWLGLLVAVVAAAVVEELVFRGILSRTLEATWLGMWGGAALSSALFALIHLQYGIGGQIIVFALGMTFAWLRARYASVWPGIVAHAANNAIAVLAMKAIA